MHKSFQLTISYAKLHCKITFYNKIIHLFQVGHFWIADLTFTIFGRIKQKLLTMNSIILWATVLVITGNNISNSYSQTGLKGQNEKKDCPPENSPSHIKETLPNIWNLKDPEICFFLVTLGVIQCPPFSTLSYKTSPQINWALLSIPHALSLDSSSQWRARMDQRRGGHWGLTYPLYSTNDLKLHASGFFLINGQRRCGTDRQIYNGILFSHRKEQNCAICREVDGPRICHTEWSKSGREKQILTHICGF